MQPATDWGQAWTIVGGGLMAVFIIMTLLAASTHLMGKLFQGVERRKKERAKAAKAAEAEEASA